MAALRAPVIEMSVKNLRGVQPPPGQARDRYNLNSQYGIPFHKTYACVFSLVEADHIRNVARHHPFKRQSTGQIFFVFFCCCFFFALLSSPGSFEKS